MAILLLLVLGLGLLGGVGLLGVGAFALYEGFSKEEGVWLGSPITARVVGIIAVILALILICGITAVLTFGVFGVVPLAL
jgi:hypothetical protein